MMDQLVVQNAENVVVSSRAKEPQIGPARPPRRLSILGFARLIPSAGGLRLTGQCGVAAQPVQTATPFNNPSATCLGLLNRCGFSNTFLCHNRVGLSNLLKKILSFQSLQCNSGILLELGCLLLLILLLFFFFLLSFILLWLLFLLLLLTLLLFTLQPCPQLLLLNVRNAQRV